MGMINIYVVHADAEARLAQELYGFLLPQVRSVGIEIERTR